mmetsp:Transcript_73736/g.205090  ORF Transcript_73736/g.205090 Transcript_73736/m.205090 type:complete len:302 (-) Transcript_73736:586-1491(-)
MANRRRRRRRRNCLFELCHRAMPCLFLRHWPEPSSRCSRHAGLSPRTSLPKTSGLGGPQFRHSSWMRNLFHLFSQAALAHFVSFHPSSSSPHHSWSSLPSLPHAPVLPPPFLRHPLLAPPPSPDRFPPPHRHHSPTCPLVLQPHPLCFPPPPPPPPRRGTALPRPPLLVRPLRRLPPIRRFLAPRPNPPRRTRGSSSRESFRESSSWPQSWPHYRGHPQPKPCHSRRSSSRPRPRPHFRPRPPRVRRRPPRPPRPPVPAPPPTREPFSRALSRIGVSREWRHPASNPHPLRTRESSSRAYC